MLLEPEDWKREWGEDNLVFASERGNLLPPRSREFVTSYGLPRCIIYENPLEGDWEEYVSAEVSFEFLSKPLDYFNTGIQWGDFYDEELDKAWAEEIVIGDYVSCQYDAQFCVHQRHETIKLINIESDK